MEGLKEVFIFIYFNIGIRFIFFIKIYFIDKLNINKI